MSVLSNGMLSIAQLLGGDMPKQRYQTIGDGPKQSKSGAWYIRPWVDIIDPSGKLVRQKRTINLGPAAIGKRKATQLGNQALAQVNQAAYVIQSQIRLDALLVDYDRRHIEKLAASTQGKYRDHVRNHIKPAFGNLMLCEITTPRIQDWLDSKELSWSTKTDIRNVLSSVFTKASDWGVWKERNPVERVSAGRKRMVRERVKLTDEQTRQLLARLPHDVRLLCCVGLFCTLRVSEILGIREKRLNFAANTIEVRERYYRGDVDQTKNAKAVRDVPMGYLADDLRRLCIGDPERFIFQVETRPNWGHGRATCRDDRDLNQHFLRPVAKALGIYFNGFGFHALRREAVTAYSGSMGIGQAMSMAGHTNADMSLLYTMSDRVRQDAAVREFQERIIGKPEGGIQ